MAGRQRVAIVGVGYSTVGRDTGLSLDALTAQASVAAMADAGVTPRDIDGVAVHSFPHQYVSATHTAAMLGIPDLAFYSGSVDGAAYAVAAMHGIAAVASGSSEMCLTLRTVHRSGAAGGTALLGGDGSGGVGGNFQFSMPYGSFTGSHFAGLYMRRHMAQYGTKEEDFGAFAVAQREYAIKNPAESFFHEPLTIEEYMNSRYIAKPLHLLDCDYPVDSSSALIFTTEERARDLRQKPVFFESWASGTTAEADFSLVEDMTRSSPFMAARRMWSRTGLKPSDVGVAGLYDGFSFIALQWLEALGFCGEGESGPFVAAGSTRPDGIIPTNTDGGACNVGRRHGANFFIEVTRQLRGTAGDRALPRKPTVGVAANAVGGFSGCALLTAELGLLPGRPHDGDTGAPGVDASPELLAGIGEVMHVGHPRADEHADVRRASVGGGLEPRSGDDITLAHRDEHRHRDRGRLGGDRPRRDHVDPAGRGGR
jgi:acetyl-CoA acetyltransferase